MTPLQIKIGLGVVLLSLSGILAYRSNGWPVRMKVGNVGSFSFTVSWVSTSLSKNCALVIEGKILPRKIWSVCEQESSRAHLIAITNLKENQTYRTLVYQGWKVYWHTLKTVATFISSPEPVMPDPAYGSVVDYKGNPVKEALVYVYPFGLEHAYPEAVLTNQEGNYALDLSFYRGGTGNWIVEGGKTPEQWNYLVTGDTTSPLPTLEVGVYE